MRNKEMVYSDLHKRCFLAMGIIDGFRYYVKHTGTHPCCYVSLPEECYIDFEKQKDYLKDSISCHGGVSYIETELFDSENEFYIPGKFIGWDYAHKCDFVSGPYGHDGIKYSTEFLVDECLDVIEQLREIERYLRNPRYLKVIAIDFDGVICTNKYPEIGTPNWYVIDKAVEEQHNGAKLVLWTCRCGEELTKAIDACTKWGLTFDAINDNIEEMKLLYGNNTRKVSATEYWDDHNVLIKDFVGNDGEEDE